MKLVDLVSYFRQGGTFEDFCRIHSVDPESEVIEIYAEEPVSLESNLGFFPIEKTEGRIEYESNGKNYHNLFDFFNFLEMVDEVRKDEGDIQDSDIAGRFLSYALDDA